MSNTFKIRDEFKRKVIAQKIISLINSDIDVSPMVLDGPWGSGKTEFCVKLTNLTEEQEEGFKVLYLNTFQYDHSDDPLMMLVANISNHIEDRKQKDEFLKKSLPVVKVLGKTAGKAAISWVLKTNASDIADELSEAISEGGNELVDVGIKKALEDFENIQENLTLFKKILKEITVDKKMVIILDELDRCRPSFALSLMEKVKHVFDMKDVVFIFSTNVDQLEAMVKKQYGHSIDASNYLSKFFSFTIKLPTEIQFSSRDTLLNSFYLFKSMSKDFTFYQDFGDGYHLEEILKHLFKVNDISLRDAEKLIRNIKILNAVGGDASLAKKKYWWYSILVLISVFIYTFKQDLAKKILNESITGEDISHLFGLRPELLKKSDRRNIQDTTYALFLIHLDEKFLHKFITDEEIQDWTKLTEEVFRGDFRGISKDSKLYQKEIMRCLQLV